MTFETLSLNGVYSSEEQNLVMDFYNPILSEAVTYQRIAGYFSSNTFSLAYKGLSTFIRNGGKMQFILNVQLSPEDYEQIKAGTTTPEKIINDIFLNDLNNLEDECQRNHAKVLGWLVATGRLEIKIGYMRDGSSTPILHQKSGIFNDSIGNCIAFMGSNNETAGGWKYNSESFTVFCNWLLDDETYLNYITPIKLEFEKLWNNESSKTCVIPFPEAARKNIISLAPDNDEYIFEILKQEGHSAPIDSKIPGIHPHKKEAKTVELRNYQKQAIDSWIHNNYHGILEMATGTGKTITAIEAFRRVQQLEEKLICVITCPFLHLCVQWKKEIKAIIPDQNVILANSSDSKWEINIIQTASKIYIRKKGCLVVITTGDTASSKKFLSIIEKFTTQYPIPLMLIGDEAHTLGAENTQKALVEEYRYRLGLSATPERYFDDSGTDALMDYFNDTVFCFSLGEAIKNSYLTKYEYYVRFAKLTNEEEEDYMAKTRAISLLFAKKEAGIATKEELLALDMLILKRQEIVKNAVNKYSLFKKLIIELLESGQLDHTLVYCSPEQIGPVHEILDDIRREKKTYISEHKFTSEEDARKKGIDGLTERERILSNFDKGRYQILVAIKCLDEGVDVPSTKTAILLCSSGNPKEYVQRRGRILRNYPGKDKAILYDFVALPKISTELTLQAILKIIEGQTKRMKIFSEDSSNKPNIESLILDYYSRGLT